MIIDITRMKKRPKPIVNMGWIGTLGIPLRLERQPIKRIKSDELKFLYISVVRDPPDPLCIRQQYD
jgi:hypothetical protein